MSSEKQNENLNLLNTAINLYSNGSQSKFCKMIEINESTVKAWRKRNTIPSDKIVLLKTLIELHEAKQKLLKYESYFTLQKELNSLQTTK